MQFYKTSYFTYKFSIQAGDTALYTAIMDKNTAMVEMLLGFGEDPCVTEWVII